MRYMSMARTGREWARKSAMAGEAGEGRSGFQRATAAAADDIANCPSRLNRIAYPAPPPPRLPPPPPPPATSSTVSCRCLCHFIALLLVWWCGGVVWWRDARRMAASYRFGIGIYLLYTCRINFSSALPRSCEREQHYDSIRGTEASSMNNMEHNTHTHTRRAREQEG
jgi:hypothetical protein